MRSALLALLLFFALAVTANSQGPTGVAGAAAAAPVATAAQDDSSDDTADDPGDDSSSDDSSDDSGDDDTSDPGDFNNDPLDGNNDPGTCGDYGDYAYGCGGCTPSDYADYTYYCVEASAGGAPTPVVRKRDKGVSAGDGAGGTVQTLPASTLPYTGDHPWVVALIGLSFLMIGAGGRLRLKRR